MTEQKFDPNDPESLRLVHDLEVISLRDGRELRQVYTKRKFPPAEEEMSRWISEDGLSILASVESKQGFTDILHVSVSRLVGSPTQTDINRIAEVLFRDNSPLVQSGQVSTQPYSVLHFRQAPPSVNPNTYWAGQITENQHPLHDMRDN